MLDSSLRYGLRNGAGANSGQLSPPPPPPSPVSSFGQTARNAGDRLSQLFGIGKITPGKVAGLGVLGSLLGAASEFGDTTDIAGTAGNTVDAAGNFGGSLLGGAAGLAGAAALGMPVVGIPALAIGALAAAAAGQAGKGLTRSISDGLGFTSSDPRAKELSDALKAQQAGIAIAKQKQETMLPLYERQLRIDREDAIAKAFAQSQLTRDQNYQNALLSGLLNQSSTQQSAINQILAQATTV